jgi:alcohol dehydrogenase (cytochrome c)
VLATAGDLVFSASVDGFFFALHATSGEPLWKISLGGRPHASPMAYAVDGRQFVAVTMGNVVYAFGLSD